MDAGTLAPMDAKIRASMVVKQAAKIGIELDYSPESLTHIDTIIDKDRQVGIGMTDDMKIELTSLAAYVGEVMIRNMNAKWARGVETPTQDPLLILVDEKYAINVVSMVMRRFASGEPASVAKMYKETEKLRAEA